MLCLSYYGTRAALFCQDPFNPAYTHQHKDCHVLHSVSLLLRIQCNLLSYEECYMDCVLARQANMCSSLFVMQQEEGFEPTSQAYRVCLVAQAILA
jgi:hypothetical protein